ncbi:phenylalanyl-tRNA synthetase [Tirmania nivea]|nr:phenylalanyl-tRNA synthetase [Tirmania nivea]
MRRISILRPPAPRTQLPPPRRSSSSSSTPATPPPAISLLGRAYPTDCWTNITPSIAAHLAQNLHLRPSHPIAITRSLIESRFPAPTYTHHTRLPPIVTTGQNFDSLGFPPDHPGRARSDTYYVNAGHVLRTHTSAHQLDLFRENRAPGFLVSADVYRRDAIDRSHYPVFHQMEGARGWDLARTSAAEISAEAGDLASLTCALLVEDPHPPFHEQRNPLQPQHSPEAAAAVAAHLKRSLESVVLALFSSAGAAAADPGSTAQPPLKVRWVEAYFPFTSPSWELEVLWRGSWLELLGCGIVQHPILAAARLPPTHISWAFGVGLERIAMVLFGIPDIRLFWSRDERFTSQFVQGQVARFREFSRFPGSCRDMAFWLPGAAAGAAVHENDVMEVVRGVGGDLVEDVALKDEFTHPKTGRASRCYRVHYRSLERTLTSEEVNAKHAELERALKELLGVEIR